MVIALIHVSVFKSKFVFKVFTHVQLSGSTLQCKGVNNSQNTGLQLKQFNLPAHTPWNIFLWSHDQDHNTRDPSRFDGYRKMQIVRCDPRENQKGLPSDFKIKRQGRHNWKKRWKRGTQKFILEQGWRVGPMVLCRICAHSWRAVDQPDTCNDRQNVNHGIFQPQSAELEDEYLSFLMCS